MMGLPRPLRRRAGPGLSADQLREQRLDEVRRLAEGFLMDLGLLLAGHPAPLEEHMSPVAAARLRGAVQPFLASGDVMRPNFGDYAELRVEGDLLAPGAPPPAHVDFDDRSIRETAGGDLLPSSRRRLRLTLEIEPGLRRIAGFSLRPGG